MMTYEQITKCHEEWKTVEMSYLSAGHLKEQRLKLYHKWFVKLLDHARKVDRKAWNAGL